MQWLSASILLLFQSFLCSYGLHLIKYPVRTYIPLLYSTTLSKQVVLEETTSNSTFDALLKERERRRLDYIAADIALRKYESMIKQHANQNESLLDVDDVKGFASSRLLFDSNATAVPMSAIQLARLNFKKEFKNLLNYIQQIFTQQNSIQSEGYDSIEHQVESKLRQLRLSNNAVWKREHSRKAIEAPLVIKIPYYILCLLLDTLFDSNPIARFYFLETVARMPYFSYITMIHAYETLGWWRRSTEAKRIHFAEEFNEYHHLLIMESLGGDREWKVRFLAQHSSIIYYFALIIVWLLSPTLAYNFSELIEAHAVDTYSQFVDENESLLKSIKAPSVAKDYYESTDMYIFDEFQTSRPLASRRPTIDTLYDVFCNIRDDEKEHVSTMKACQDPEVLIRSPNTEASIAAAALSLILLNYFLGSSEFIGEENGMLFQFSKGFTERLPEIQNLVQQSGLTTDGAAVDGLSEVSDELAPMIVQSATAKALINFISKILPFFKPL